MKAKTKIIAKILGSIVVIGLFLTPRIIVNYLEKQNAESLNEMMGKGIVKSPQEMINTCVYKDGDFSFEYPCSYKIVQDTIALDRHLLFFENKESGMMISYTTLKNQHTIESKRYNCNEELRLCRLSVLKVASDANFEEIEKIKDENPILKYRFSYESKEVKGECISLMSDKYQATINFFATNEFDYNVLNRISNAIEIE